MTQPTSGPTTDGSIMPGSIMPGSTTADSPLRAGPGADPARNSATQSEPAPTPVATGRDRIDAVDAQIIELMLRRIEISRQIQAARLTDGGRRIDLRRETEVIGRYTAALGRSGTAVGMALLELGRGRMESPGAGARDGASASASASASAGASAGVGARDGSAPVGAARPSA